jgi:hypothetical protein
MDYDRLRGVLVAQQKGVPAERLAGLVNGESGRRDRFESCSIYLNHNENILDGASAAQHMAVTVSVTWQWRKVLCASIELKLRVFPLW